MKKLFFLIVCNALIIQEGYSQFGYYDAIELSGYIDPSTGRFKSDDPSLIKVAEILKNYVSGLADETGFSNVLRTITTNSPNNPGYNPILAPYLAGQVGQGSDVISGRSKSFLGSVGELNVTNFADGLAKFLVARAKEELNVAFFTKFQDFLKDYPEVKVVFPQTYDFMSQIYAYQYAAMLPALRAGFQQDMIDFSDNLIRLRDMTASDCEGVKDPDCLSRIKSIDTFMNDKLAGRSIVAALLSYNSIMKGSNAAVILSEITYDRIVKDHDDNLSNIIHFSNMISESLRSKEEDAIWVNKSELNKLLSNRDAFRIYLGLLYALDGLKPDRITFFSNNSRVPLTQLLEKTITADTILNELKQSLSAFGNASAEVSSLAKNIVRSSDESQQTSILLYADYASSISEMLRKGVTFFHSMLPEITKDVEPFLDVIDYATDACYDVKSQNYGSLVLHTSKIMEEVLGDKYTYSDDYIKYGSFMAGIIEADNSDEVKAAIEAAVLPVGSASIKRQTISNISLNGYIGGMVGYEYLGGLTEDPWAPILGVTAPVGVAYSWGRLGNGTRKDPPKTKWKSGNAKGGKSFTLFVPLIDVGAIATFRLADETSNVAAEVKLKNIIAPGLYGYWGFGKVPVSAGFGVQVGPQLREINAEAINVDQNFYLRFGFNLVVDIPFFNFYTRN